MPVRSGIYRVLFRRQIGEHWANVYKCNHYIVFCMLAKSYRRYQNQLNVLYKKIE